MTCRLAVVPALLALAGCGSPNPSVTTYHNDNLRTGAYLAETTLAPDAVANRGMHIKFWVPPCEGPARDPHDRQKAVGCIRGAIVTQPLYARRLTVSVALPFLGHFNVTGPVVFVATTANIVYAFSADTGLPLWSTDLMRDENGAPLRPGYLSRWVTSTPVIDLANNRMYVV